MNDHLPNRGIRGQIVGPGGGILVASPRVERPEQLVEEGKDLGEILIVMRRESRMVDAMHLRANDPGAEPTKGEANIAVGKEEKKDRTTKDDWAVGRTEVAKEKKRRR